MFKINKNNEDWGYLVLVAFMLLFCTIFLNSCAVMDNMKNTARVNYNVKKGKVTFSTKPCKHITLKY